MKNRRENDEKVSKVTDGVCRSMSIATLVSLIIDIGIMIYLIIKAGIFC